MSMKFKTISDSKRNRWFAKNFGILNDGGARVEVEFFELLQETCESYNGGYFGMVEFENGAKALMIDSNEIVEVSVPTNYFDGQMTKRALSLAAWMCTVNKMCWSLYDEGEIELSKKFSEMFYRIRDALAEDPEASLIFAYAD